MHGPGETDLVLYGGELPIWTVTADPKTGLWFGEPEDTGEWEKEAKWCRREDTDRERYDTYEACDTETRALIVVWADHPPCGRP